MSYSISPKLTLTWGIDISFEKLTPEKGDGFENHPLHYVSGVGISYKACLPFQYV